MLFSVAIRNRLVGTISGSKLVKMTAAAYCYLLKEVLDPWLDDILLSLNGV